MKERDEQPDSPAEHAIAKRLAALRSKPIDTQGLRRRVFDEIDAGDAAPNRWTIFSRVREFARVWSPRRVAGLSAIAASILIVAMVLFFTLGQSPRAASAADLAQLYSAVASDPGHGTAVNSIDEANRVLSNGHPTAPCLPRTDQPVMACCQHMIDGKCVACVCLNVDGSPVVLTAGTDLALACSKWPKVQREGHTYSINQTGNLTLIGRSDGASWFCVIGKQPPDRLINIAAAVKL